MLTLYTIPKAFDEHIGIIQRNAIRSWTLLRPPCEVILFGDDAGTAEVAALLRGCRLPRIPKETVGYTPPLCGRPHRVRHLAHLASTIAARAGDRCNTGRDVHPSESRPHVRVARDDGTGRNR